MSVLCSSTKMSRGQHLSILVEMHKNGVWSFQNLHQILLVISCNILLALQDGAVTVTTMALYFSGTAQKDKQIIFAPYMSRTANLNVPQF